MQSKGSEKAILEQHPDVVITSNTSGASFRKAEVFQSIEAQANQINFAHLPTSSQGGPGISVISVKANLKAGPAVVTFSARDVPIPEELDSLLTPLNQLYGAMSRAPVAALQVHIEAAGSGFNVVLNNPGSEKVCLADPRVTEMDFTDLWTGVRIALFPEEVPGYSAPPLEWETLPLQQVVTHLPEPPIIEIASGEELMLPTLAWEPVTRGVRYLVRAVHSDYRGGSDVAGCYRVRGAAFFSGDGSVALIIYR